MISQIMLGYSLTAKNFTARTGRLKVIFLSLCLLSISYLLIDVEVIRLSSLFNSTPTPTNTKGNLTLTHTTSGKLARTKSDIKENIPTWASLYLEPIIVSGTETASSKPSISFTPRIWPSNSAHEFQALNGYNIDRTTSYEYELPLHIWGQKSKSIHDTDDKCEFYSKKWHTKSFPTCNILHEVDFQTGIERATYTRNTKFQSNGVVIDLLSGKGATRQAWKLSTESSDVFGISKEVNHLYNDRPVVFKKLKMGHKYTETMYEHQRIDALATERLTPSAHVIDIYGFCGESVINEYADGGDLKSFFKTYARNITSDERLVFATDAALGLADIHSIDGEGTMSTLAHHDTRPANLLIVNGKLKFHDFNMAELLKWNFEEGKRCGFNFRKSCKKMLMTREPAPELEECDGDPSIATEKLEVYRLGLTIFFFLLNSRGLVDPVDDQELDSIEENMEDPNFSQPKYIEESNDPAINAILDVMRGSLTYEAGKRPSARMIADELLNTALENAIF